MEIIQEHFLLKKHVTRLYFKVNLNDDIEINNTKVEKLIEQAKMGVQMFNKDRKVKNKYQDKQKVYSNVNEDANKIMKGNKYETSKSDEVIKRNGRKHQSSDYIDAK